MSFVFKPAKRENTPIVIGLAGPTKSGKTMSALRIAMGLAEGGQIAMLNAEGSIGRQYADRFDYVEAEMKAPYRPERYTEAVEEAGRIKPAVLIIDSMSHMHDGPGGMLEYHEDELDRMGKKTDADRQKSTWTAWIRPKAAENKFIYRMQELNCHVIFCFRAKEKQKILPGKSPVDLGWQPISSDRVAFETLFTLLLPPHSKGIPDKELSDMREPFDRMISFEKQLSETTGEMLLAWSRGGVSKSNGHVPAMQTAVKSADSEAAAYTKARDEARALLVAAAKSKGKQCNSGPELFAIAKDLLPDCPATKNSELSIEDMNAATAKLLHDPFAEDSDEQSDALFDVEPDTISAAHV